MKKYSERIIEEIEKIDNQIIRLKTELKENNYEELKQLLETKNEEELSKIKNLENEKIIKKIQLELKSEFEQIKELEKKLNKLEEKHQKIKELTNKKEILEYIYDLGLPIEENIEDIMSKCKNKNINTIEILKLIIEENINTYKYKKQKEEFLTEEKMKQKNIDKDTIEKIKEIKETLANNSYQETTEEMINYLMNIDEENLIKTLEDISYKKPVMLGIIKKILEKIDNEQISEKIIILLMTLYETYKEQETNEIKEEPQKLIFISKSTSTDLYIYDELKKIQDRIYKRIVNRELNNLYNGNLEGKSLTGLPENLFEKKNWKIRITYKILPNNYVLVLNCYIKGDKQAQNIRELITKNNVSKQIQLYNALASDDQTKINQTIKQLRISNSEIENYTANFENCKTLNILKEGEQKCLKK